MSSVKIQGSTTGTAVFTVSVPDGTSTDRTIELPDAAGSFVTADASGNVGIGTVSPSANAEIRGSASNGQMRLGGSTTGTYASFYSDNDGVLVLGADAGNNAASSYLGFEVDGSEAARFDASRNLLVGTTDSTLFNNSGSGTGINLQNFGNIAVARDGADCMVLNRLNSDGNILLIK